ncbi:MAG: DNA polymerase/3'-5' exonuclease PolX [Candidatus Omnitrophica bacterium]|nr:DNA polymerase/3'-5' exonuclease PolX [Candidatus Omnitrophota bacterium]
MDNHKISEIFEAIADILEFKQDNQFKIRAYRRAAASIRAMSEDINEFAKANPLNSIPGIGKDLSEKIEELLKTGALKSYEELKESVPGIIFDMMRIPGVGPKTAKLLYDELKIDSVEKLKKYAKEHKLSQLSHLKEKTEANILKGIELLEKSSDSMLLGDALPMAEGMVNYLKQKSPISKIDIAGSARRMKQTVKDIDILVSSKKPQAVMHNFVNMPTTERVLVRGDTKSSILTRQGIQVDIRVVEPASYGAALVYFTGSKEHNVRLRELAVKKKLKINEYGVYSVKGGSASGGKKIAGKTEEEVYASVGLKYIEPELREDRGEIGAALKNKLPKLIEISDIRGDFHVHSNYSDGINTIEEMARFCKNLGYEYVVISDHSKSLKVAGGLSEQDLIKKNREIDAINKKIKGFKVLKGVEVDIDSDGNLDYSDEVLKDLDVVLAAIHTGFKQSKEVITKRILRAMDNKHVDIITHPTGRLLNAREPYAVDMTAVLKHAKKTGTVIEINGYPERLDLDDINSRIASEMGVKIALTTDSHRVEQLLNMRFAVSVARRAWLTQKDVLNTLSLKQICAI